MSHNDISDETLNAFIDGELDASGKSEVFEALGEDRELSQQACELRRLGELVRHAYDHPPKIERYRKDAPRRMSPWAQGLAASLLLGMGATLGWALHQPETTPAGTTLSAMYWDEHNAFQNTDISKVTAQQGAKRIIVHLNTSSVSKFEEALTTAEQLLEAYDENGAEIEVVANASAIRLLRAGYSPYADRVHELQQRYINLTFLACQDASDHVREIEGGNTQVKLLPDVDVTPSALEHILNRLSEGWVYLNV
jgi:intracellular sulfur oxidation DsrE/DsrF family protein